MKKWKTVNIGSLGQVVTGNTPLTSDREFYGGTHPFIKPTDMDIDRRRVTIWEENYSEKAFKKYKNSYIPTGSTGVVTIGTVGEKLFQADQPCFTNQSVNVVIPESGKYNADFIYYLMKYNLPQVSAANPGTASGRHHVSKSNFCAIKVQVPEEIKTQEKIASILSAYDDLIENNLKRVNLLEELAQRTYEEWFVKYRINGKQLKINKETGLPEKWIEVPLGTFVKFHKGKKANLIIEKYQEGFEKLLLLDGIESGKYLFADPMNQVIAERGDVVMLMDGARSSKVFFADKGIVGSTLSKIEIINKNISSSLLRQFFESNFETMKINNTGAAIPHANRNYIITMPFKIATSDILQKWKDSIDPIYKQIQNLKDQSLLLKESRDRILPRLMTGIIEVK